MNSELIIIQGVSYCFELLWRPRRPPLSFTEFCRGISNIHVQCTYYVRNHKWGAQIFIQQLAIESGTIAVTILALPLDNWWLNSVQKQMRASQVSDKIEFKISRESLSYPPIERRESPYSTIDCWAIGLGRFGPEKKKYVLRMDLSNY